MSIDFEYRFDAHEKERERVKMDHKNEMIWTSSFATATWQNAFFRRTTRKSLNYHYKNIEKCDHFVNGSEQAQSNEMVNSVIFVPIP